MVAAAAAGGPRYAPPDATLPSPWRALVDGSTGYIYYWNPETNVTQYEKPQPAVSAPPPLPAGPPPASVAAGPKLAPIPNGPSSLSGELQNGTSVNGHINTNSNSSSNGAFLSSGASMPGQPKLAAIPMPRGPQVSGGMSITSHMAGGNASRTVSNPISGPAGYKRGPDDYDYSEQDAYKRPRTQGYSEPAIMDVEAYRRQHEITALYTLFLTVLDEGEGEAAKGQDVLKVILFMDATGYQGENVPMPFMTFEAASFAPDLLREVRYLLQLGAYVVRCTVVQQNCSTLLSSYRGCI